MNGSSQTPKHRVVIGMGSSLLLLLILVSFIGRTLADSRLAANLDSSYKTVDLSQAETGQSLQYTIFISNTGDMSATHVLLNDVLPTELIYQTDSLTLTTGSNYMTAGYGEDNGVITWTGTISGPGYVGVTFEAMLLGTLSPGDLVTNTAIITGTGSWLTRTVATTIITSSLSSPEIYMPVVFKDVPVPALQISPPVNNQWTVSWSDLGAGITYELQEANTPDFANATTYALSATSKNIVHSAPDIYYYRVRGMYEGQAGGWSEVESVLVGQLTLTATRPNEFNDWAVGWTSGGSGVTTYELQEAHSQTFASPQSYVVQSATSRIFFHEPSTDNYYCYRARVLADGHIGAWSNVVCLVGGYRDDFSDDSTNWAIRRQDTDDVDNKFYYREKDGEYYFVVEIDGRWDYGVASPLNMAPEPPYAIETRVRLHGQDNLNSYGIVFGGDWNGTSECPNEDYDDCFNHYYRLMFLWFGAQNKLKMQLKRIDSHSGSNNGVGETLLSFRDVTVNSPSGGFQTWRVEVGADGLITIFANGNEVAHRIDTTYIGNPYFGVFAGTDEYLGAEPWYDWYEVKPLAEE